MAKRRGKSSGLDVAAMLKLMTPLQGDAAGNGVDPKMRQRRLLADLCRLIGNHLSSVDQPDPQTDLSPRMRQTLQSLLAGDSEKQAATKLGVSQNTVHVYVKQLYRKFDVNSRGELLSKWVNKT
jgi:DNA-binding NarL/FixJ family response regulator